jgi:ABC-type polysaccharide/polyol phosphate export permease
MARKTIRARITALWGSTRTLFQLGFLLFLRDYRARFRQTFFGSLWAVGQVLLSYVPLVMVGSHFGLGGGQKLYALHSMLGLLMWQMFWDGLYLPQWIGRRLRGVLGEISFPLEAVLIAGGCYAAFNATFYLLIILAGYFVVGVMPPASFVLGILAMPLVIAAGLSIGVYFVPLTFIYLDFRYALPLMQPALMWTAPILYETPASGALHWMNRLNPLTYLIAVPRDWFAEGWRLEEAAFPITIGISLVLLAAGLRFYHYSMPRALECLPRR